MSVDYQPPGPVAHQFMRSNARRRVIMGPFGSGKSVACCAEIMRRSRAQTPSSDNVRRTRWAVVRNTYPDLKNTTVKTWRDWWNDDFGTFSRVAPFVHHMKYPMGDGTRVDCEVIFLAMDDEADAKKFLSLELTGIYFNEVRELKRAIIEAGDGRLGRYPSMKDGGPTWYGMIADTNMPDEDHWLYALAEDGKGEGWKFYRQPGGVIKHEDRWIQNPQAENLQNLTPKYYVGQLAGKSDAWISVNLAAEYGRLPSEGAYFAEELTALERQGRVCGISASPDLPVHTFWDIGVSDYMAIWFGQSVGSNVNLWGEYINANQQILEQAMKGYQEHVVTGDATISWTNYTAGNVGQCGRLKLTGSPAAAFALTFPGKHNFMSVENTTLQTGTIKCSGGTGVAIAAGAKAFIFCDGVDYINAGPNILGTGNVTVSGKISGVTAGAAATDAVNKTQMETAIATAGLPATAGTVLNSLSDTTPGYHAAKHTVVFSSATTTQIGGLLSVQFGTLNPGGNEKHLMTVAPGYVGGFLDGGVQSAGFTPVVGRSYDVDCSSAGVTVDLSSMTAPQVGQEIKLNNFGYYPMLLLGTVNGQTNMQLDSPQNGTYRYTGSSWGWN